MDVLPFDLARVPPHWSVAPLAAHFDERKTQVSDTDYAPLSVTKDGVVPQLESAAKTDNNDSRRLVRAGDFVINSRSDRKGSSGLSALDGSVSLIYTVLTPRGSIHPLFAHHLLRSRPFQEEFYRWGVGIVDDLWTTRYSAMKRIPLPLPPIDEQRRIADFLDRETAQIDALIAKQEQFIAGLRERRDSLVGRVVFEGLRGGPLAESAARWLPSTPAAWPITQLGYVANTLAGYAFPSEGFTQNPTHTRLLRGINVKPGGVDWSEVVYWDCDTDPVPARYQLNPGDLVLGMDRPFIGSGVRVATITEQDAPALLLQRVLRIRPTRLSDQGYLRHLFSTQAFSMYLEPMFTGVSVPHISEWQVRKFRIPLPPLSEQHEISVHLDEQAARIDALIVKAGELIALARDRRAALITEAVTGRLGLSSGRAV